VVYANSQTYSNNLVRWENICKPCNLGGDRLVESCRGGPGVSALLPTVWKFTFLKQCIKHQIRRNGMRWWRLVTKRTEPSPEMVGNISL
jgi:hypothetical protein